MQDLDWPFNPQPGLCHFIQSSPGIREKHSTNLRLIVLIHSTFFRERQSALSKQCLGKRRIENIDDLNSELEKWHTDRNERQKGVNWQFTTDDARIKLKHLYPVVTF